MMNQKLKSSYIIKKDLPGLCKGTIVFVKSNGHIILGSHDDLSQEDITIPSYLYPVIHSMITTGDFPNWIERFGDVESKSHIEIKQTSNPTGWLAIVKRYNSISSYTNLTIRVNTYEQLVEALKELNVRQFVY